MRTGIMVRVAPDSQFPTRAFDAVQIAFERLASLEAREEPAAGDTGELRDELSHLKVLVTVSEAQARLAVRYYSVLTVTVLVFAAAAIFVVLPNGSFFEGAQPIITALLTGLAAFPLRRIVHLHHERTVLQFLSDALDKRLELAEEKQRLRSYGASQS